MVISQTISLKKGSEGSRKCFIVECRPADGNNKAGWSKSFDCDDDAEAEANALRFAFSTECFAEFRRFLLGNKDEGLSDSSTSVSAGSGGTNNRRKMRGNFTVRARNLVVSRTKSRRNVRTMFVCVRTNVLSGLRFVAAVGETGGGRLRSASFRVSDSVEEAIEKAVRFLRGGTGLWSRDGHHRGDAGSSSRTVSSCRCCGGQLGKNNNDAMLDDTQLFEDTICLACLKVEKKEIVVIRMDEQGLYSEMSLKDICNDSKHQEMVAEEQVCCICGCEDNEVHEAMIYPCTCNGGSVVAHPSCVDASLATSRFCNRQAGTSCKVCGGNGRLSNGELLIDTQTRTGEAEDEFFKLTNSNPSLRKKVIATNSTSRALKRARRGLPSNESLGQMRSPSNSVKEDSGGQLVSTPEKEDMPISESEKVRQKVSTRRFNDAVTSVPIKKRKFNLVCSPSPPRSPSPENAKPKTFCSEVSSPERSHAKSNGHGEQHILDSIDITKECPQQDFGDTNENEIQSTVMCKVHSITEKVDSCADFSGISMLAAAACISDLETEDVGARAQLQLSESATLASLSVKDNMEILGGGEFTTEPGIHEKNCNEQTHVIPKIDQVSALEDNRHMGHEEEKYMRHEAEKYVSLGKSNWGLVLNDKVGQPIDLGLVSNNISREPGISSLANDGNAIGSCPVKLSENGGNLKGKLLRLDSGYWHDDRLHWDLNTVMDKWENPPEDLIKATGKESSPKIPGGSLNNKNLGCSEDIHVRVAVAEWKGDARSLEQDTLGKGFQDGMDVHQLKIVEQFSPFEKHVDSNISFSSRIDTNFKHRSVQDEVLVNCDLLPMSVATSDGSGDENSLNLSIALSQGTFDSAKDVYTGSEIGRVEANNASQVSKMHLQVPADRHLTLIPEIDASCKVEQGIALVKDPMEVLNETYTEENHSGYKKEFSSPQHAKHEIEVCHGPEVQKGVSGPDPACDSMDNEPNVGVSPLVRNQCFSEMTNTNLVGNTSLSVDENFCKVVAPTITIDKSVCKLDSNLAVDEGFCNVDGTMAVNDSVCNDDKPGSKDEGIGMVSEPMAIDESVSSVDTPVRVDLNVCMVGVSVINTQIDDKVDDIVAVHESVSKVDVPVTVNESVGIVNNTLTGYESGCKVESPEAVEERDFKIGLPVAGDESACNVKDTLAISQSVCMVDCHVAVDQSVCKLDASGVVDAYANSGNIKSQEDAMEENSVEMVSEVGSDGDYDCEVYEEDDEPVSHAGKTMDGQADDDSQYEDGEYRERNSCDWDEDIAEELEAERVDYGYSDCRDTDELGVSDERVSMSLQAESKCKGGDPMDTENVEHEKNRNVAQRAERDENCMDNHQVLHDREVAEAIQVSSHKQGNIKANAAALCRSEIGGDPKSIKIFSQDSQTAMDSHEPTESRDVKNPSSSRQKFSGWDKLPQGFTNAEEALKSVGENNTKRGQGFGWAGPSQRCCVGQIGSIEAIQMDRAKYFASGRDGVYLPRIRDDGLDTSPRFPSRGTGRARTAGRGGSLHGMRSRGRGDPWMGPQNGQWGSSRHHSPNYYASPTGFGPLGQTNAAAVAAAKAESNGFVVAPDGTIVKASSSGLASRGEMCPLTGIDRSGQGKMMGKGSSVDDGNRMFGMQKGMGPGRDTSVSPDRGVSMGRGRNRGRGRGRAGFGSTAIGLLRRGGPERYVRELFSGNGGLDPSMDDSHRSIHSVDYRLVRRDRSLSPPLGRRSPTLRRSSLSHKSPSHTKSSSRSRTRSPRMWSSPRGRTFSAIDRVSGFRRRSRSPNIRSKARLERQKSPSHRVGVSGHTMSSLQSSRSQRSPPQTSKWSSDRRDAEHIRDYDSRRHSIPTRSPPGRLSPRSIDRSGLLDSLGRSKHCEYLRPLHSGRSAEFGSDSRRTRHQENEDKWKSYGNGVVHSARAVDDGSDIRHLRNEEDGLKACSSRSKEAADLQARGSPRAGDKDMVSRSGSASRRERSREDDKTDLKYSRDGRPRGSIKSSGMRELDDDVAPRRRRPS